MRTIQVAAAAISVPAVTRPATRIRVAVPTGELGPEQAVELGAADPQEDAEYADDGER